MEFRQLRHFVALAEDMHFGRAADRLCISQPALSGSIARLEEHFGVRLFDRDSKKVRITLAGELMLKSAREMLSHAARTDSFARSLAEGKAGRIEVGFSGPVLQGGLDQVILDCRRDHPEIEIVMRETTSQSQTDLVRSGRLDAGLLNFPVPPTGLEHIQLFEDRFVLCLPVGHPLTSRKTIDIELLRDECFVIPTRDRAPNTHDQLIGACAMAGFYPHISFESEGAMSTLHLVSRGLGIGFVLESLAHIPLPGVVFVPLSQVLPRRYAYFVWDAERMAPGFEALLAGIRRFASSRLAPHPKGPIT
ncbi:LysR substrate-binding domain-containing protein [Cupriavidus basilensis]|uniref:LysR substrate-binding domain-containing protein n=1 Tax=Cupriavidus basilensis TaxID=68895 RepID=UPI0023E7BB7F|nr:LysR substrate-binding domain-containing protein [Cupriavidus basilensis]MDF3888566.1 LysR substrate-binding domain-containing protein [Cupriavidus basilensis]